MVHEKYIKRGNKIFGPYLYTNYRENGKTKTKYFGKARKKNLLTRNLFIVLGIAFLILILIFLFTSQIFLDLDSLRGILPTEKFAIFVNISFNDLPEIFDLSEKILVCENTGVSSYFNVSDGNGDILTLDFREFLGIRLRFDPEQTYGNILTRIHLYTLPLTALDIERRRQGTEGWATYPETILVTDGLAVGSADTEIEIIEINDPPIFNIGTQTIDVYTIGEQTTFYYDIGGVLMANWEETPEEDLIFNLTFLSGTPFFTLQDYGVVNVTGDESLIEPGQNFTTYHINITVIDDGLSSTLHRNINLCWSLLHPTWGYPLNEDPKNWSDDFYLTITKENREPNITTHFPINLSLDVRGTELLYFNATVYDPDWTPLDVYWYVDGVERGSVEALGVNNLTEFEHAFDCGVSGNHSVKVVATDGLANGSLQWNLSVEYVSCPQPPVRRGGNGGGPRGLYCLEKWGCEEWTQCENIVSGFEYGRINRDERLLIQERCDIFNYTEEFCGFQTRTCTDFNYCKTFYTRPGIIRECYYTERPNCTDGIKNCHDGDCELLIDCGGPCEPCPTCNDGILNQNEERIDCGGVCRPCRETPFRPTLIKMLITISLLALLVLVLILVVRQVLKYKKYKKEVKKDKKKIKKQQRYLGVFVFLLFAIVLLFFANAFVNNLIQRDRIVIEHGEPGFLGTQALTNSIMSSFARWFNLYFLDIMVIYGNDADLAVWDDADDGSIDRYTLCTEYCGRKLKPNPSLWNVYFYANYTTKAGEAISPASGSGNCRINFYDMSYRDMTFNYTSLLWQYNRSFVDKGARDFDVNCTSIYDTLNISTNASITNTEPYILRTAAGYIDLDADFEREAWLCSEDTLCYYNFSANVSEDDHNDRPFLTFGYLDSPNTTLTNFKLNETTGMLEINITHDADTGQDKKIELSVRDSERTVTAVLQVDVARVNDAPYFVNLQNRTFNAQDLFEYLIFVDDEEWNVPFTFNIDFVSCYAPGNPGCVLFGPSDYGVNGTLGRINISFVPAVSDIGEYTLNFSVTDNSSLGDRTSSVLVNFTVTAPVWDESVLVLDHYLTEDSEFFLNLTEMILSIYQPSVSFSHVKQEFPSFDILGEVINFTPIDGDVGFHEVEITADATGVSSSRIFNFTVQNINDSVLIDDIQATGIIDINRVGRINITAFENADIVLYLYVRDDDFAITQKNFYDENVTINLTIIGPNENLFDFVFDSWEDESTAIFIAPFKPFDGEEGDYDVRVNVTDMNNHSYDVLEFDLTIYDRNYDKPNITFPGKEVEFNLIENVTSDLVFRANHTVGDNLSFEIFINEQLRKTFNYFGNDVNLTWPFTPNFSDETYGEIRNLTLFVSNLYFRDLNDSRTWNLTINHTNAPVQTLDDVDPRVIFYNYALEMNLTRHFYDVDHMDDYYNQNVSFVVASNATPSQISPVGEGFVDWVFILSSRVYAPFSETLNITACDLNETGGNMTCRTGNNFVVEFIPPEEVEVPVPTPSPTTTKKTIISLKIIMPREISAYEDEKIEIPISLVNNGRVIFNELNLTSIVFKNGTLSEDVRASLDKTSFSILKPGQEENLTLTVFFGEERVGEYEVLVNATSKRPRYTDWGKIHISLQRINESRVRELIVFSEELIVQNPECIEIREVIKEARAYLDREDYTNAYLKAEQAIAACEEAISQPSFAKRREVLYGISLYLVLAVLLAFGVSVVYYLLKRRKFQKMKNT